MTIPKSGASSLGGRLDQAQRNASATAAGGTRGQSSILSRDPKNPHTNAMQGLNRTLL